MTIPQLFQTKKPVISLEVFPPKPDSPMEVIDKTLTQIAQYAPDYISVTYGAGGSNSTRNRETAQRIIEDCHCPALGHLTCVGATPDMIDEVLDGFEEAGIHDVLALRGDIPKGMDHDTAFTHFHYASQLVEHIARRGGFSIGGACYPEMHFESDRMEHDLDMLKHKVDCGAQFLVTQMFFDNACYFDFLDAIRKKGIAVPVTPGVMPVRDASQILRMTTLCGASIPAKLSRLIARYGSSPEDFAKAGFEFACNQVQELIDGGSDGIHLYTMNRPKLIGRILESVYIP